MSRAIAGKGGMHVASKARLGDQGRHGRSELRQISERPDCVHAVHPARLVAVHLDDPDYMGYRDIAQLPPHRLRELQRFFIDYKVLEGKEVIVDAPLGAVQAVDILRESLACYGRERERLRASS